MASELSEIESFLKATAPFDRLGDELVRAIVRKITVRYYRSGDEILRSGEHNEERHGVAAQSRGDVGAEVSHGEAAMCPRKKEEIARDRIRM